MIKLAIVNFDQVNFGGSATWIVHVDKIFSELIPFVECKNYTLCGRDKKSKNNNTLSNDIILNYKHIDHCIEELNKYDIVYFTTLGYFGDKHSDIPVWYPIVSKLTNLLIVSVLGYYEPRLYGKYNFFLDLPTLFGIHYPTVQLYDYFQKLPEFARHKSLISPFTYIDHTKIEDSLIKRKKIITSARLTPTKGSGHLAKHYRFLKDRGYEINFNGVPQWMFDKVLMEKYGVDKEDIRGGYEFKDIHDIFKDAMCHFEYIYTRDIRTHYHLNYSMVEAMEHGCIPIICKYTCPEDFIHMVNGILIDKDDDKWIDNVLNISENEKLQIIANNLDYIEKEFGNSRYALDFEKFLSC